MEERLNLSEKIGSVINYADSIQEDCRDFMISHIGRNLWMNGSAELCFAADGYNVLPLSEWALTQLGIKTGIPGNYLSKCINSGYPSLAANNVNTWLKPKDNSKAFIRTYKNTIRGILSDRYTAFDAPEILNVLADNIPESNWDIRGSYISEERMHLRFTLSDKINIDGDSLFPAIFVDSSDVGRCALKVRFGIYRLACTNGLIIPSIETMYHQRHVGIQVTELESAVISSMKRIPEFIEKSEDLVEYAKNKKIKMLEKEDVEAVLKELRLKAKLSEDDAQKVIKITKEKYSATQWGLVNGLTEFARDCTLDTRVELEKAAGILLAA